MSLDISEYQNTIYHDPNKYDDQYWWKKNDIEFWKLLYNKHYGKKVLELGSGTGRLAIPLLKENCDYTGIEISKEFCEESKKKIKKHGFKAKIIHGDFRLFNLDKKYDFIFIGFNTFLHLLNDNDAVSFLQSIKQHMHEKTVFYIDIFVPHPLFLYRNKKRIKNLEYIDSKTKKLTYVDEICEYNSETEINKITWIYYTDESDEKKYHFTMRMYFPDTMNRLIIDSGLHIKNIWGNHSCDDFNEMSELQIYECTL
tara:strand:+ start:938 stop:1702 length:765 start_codon:yes stop_codon:yes gene_type:complete